MAGGMSSLRPVSSSACASGGHRRHRRAGRKRTDVHNRPRRRHTKRALARPVGGHVRNVVDKSLALSTVARLGGRVDFITRTEEGKVISLSTTT